MQTVRANPYRWTVEAALLPLQFSMGLNFFGPSALFPLIMDSRHVDRGTVSLLMVAVMVVMTFLLIPAGVLVTRLGAKKAIALAGLLIGLGILGGTGPSFFFLIGLRIALGVGASMLFPATSTTLVQWFTPRELPLVNSFNMAAGGIGVATAMFVGVPIAHHWGWEGVFFTYGAVTLLATLIWATLGKPAPRSHQVAAMPSLKTLLSMVRDRNTLVLAVAGMAPQVLFVAYNSWLPTYYHEVFGMPLERGTAIVAMIPIVGVVANIVGGLLMARIGLRKPFLLLTCVSFPVAAFGTFYVNNLAVISLSIITLGIGSSLFLAALFTVAMELPGIDTQRVGLVVAVVLTLGNVATAFSPLAVGMSTDKLGSYLPSLIVLALLPLVTLAVGMFLPETGPRAAMRTAQRQPALPAN